MTVYFYYNLISFLFVFKAVATATPIPNGSLNQHSESRPVYPAPRPGAYPTCVTATGGGRAHVTVDVNGPPSVSDTAYSTQSSYDSRSSLVHPPLMQQQLLLQQQQQQQQQQLQMLPPPPASMLMAQGQPSQSLANASLIESSKRNTQLGHPLKSFTVPAPPPQSAPPVKIVSPNSSNNGHRHVAHPVSSNAIALNTANPSSPYKKALATAGAGVSSPPPLHNGNGNVRGDDLRPPPPENRLHSSYSTEELNQEMANLEGLMKDLNAITANEFGC